MQLWLSVFKYNLSPYQSRMNYTLKLWRLRNDVLIYYFIRWSEFNMWSSSRKSSLTESSDADVKTKYTIIQIQIWFVAYAASVSWTSKSVFLTGFALGPKFYKTNNNVLKIKHLANNSMFNYIVVGKIMLILIEI